MKLMKVALLCILWMLLSAFEWNNAGGDPYTGTRETALARSGFPPEVQEIFLKMIREDAANEKADRSEGMYYRDQYIPEDFVFDWTMFGRDRRETNVIARTSKWKAGTSRWARVYRVQVRDTTGGTEYILFFPKVCLNPSAMTRKIPICICPSGEKVCPKKA